MKRHRLWLGILICALLLMATENAYCGKGGHYTPGIMGVRDNIMPPKSGFYLAVFNPYYYANAYSGANGKKVKELSASRTIYINNTAVDVTATADVELEIESAGTSPMLTYVFDKKILGANYGLAVSTYFGYARAKIKADVTATGSVGGVQVPGLEITRSLEKEYSDYGMGDPTFSPLWLAWRGGHYDIWLIYGVSAPLGKYDSGRFLNIGRGFWSHGISLGGVYYPRKDHSTALMFNPTYEINTRQEGSGITPGQNLSLEYGISQYFTPRLEACISGYSLFQVTEDTGGDPHSDGPNSYVHAIGGQITYWIVKNKFGVAGKYLYEYAARERTKGQLATINFYYIF